MNMPAQQQSPANIADTSADAFTAERREWLDALRNVFEEYGERGVQEILGELQGWSRDHAIALGNINHTTPYLNSIPLSRQPAYPGNIELEKRIENIMRWNAMAMVLRAQDQEFGVGGHIATYASAATMMEVGFNHFFRKRDDSYGGDLVLLQPHASPGVYARAFLEGRLTEKQLKNFRRELQPGGGLCSYPHPRLMPEFWQMPNASMGLSTPGAIYQARFARYLENRGLKPKNGGKVWCFIGDGESDEPEVLGSMAIAAREQLDNLIMVVNCNLQRLDGPVRGNGKIIQELEASYRGAGWEVIKVIWSGGWDALLAQDTSGALRRRMEECVDGDYQRYSILPGDLQREHWVDGNLELERMMASLSDEEVRTIKRGGQDPRKVYAAFHHASRIQGKPVVILVKTVKGDGMGAAAEGRNTAHQKKSLSPEERLQCARNFGIPLSDDAVVKADFYLPPEDSVERQYIRKHRGALGGSLPARQLNCPTLRAPELEQLRSVTDGSGEKTLSTTIAMIRLLSLLLKDAELGRYVVPIVPDEARTFGLEGLFRVAGIYSAQGQKYTPVDADTVVPYRESTDGQILQEGICETGAIASFMAAGTAYAVHGIPTIPFYIFYSIFGFQRVGDMIWACGDMMCRGFLLGGTAGRTTLNGEGLQHQDGHSHILASTYPDVKSYDPAFGYELAVIVRNGIHRMYTLQEKCFYYITLYNENYRMPSMPEDSAVSEGILRGVYRWQRSESEGQQIHLLASGSIMQQAIAAAEKLEALGYRVDIWSVTSFLELQRDAQECERWNRLHPLRTQKIPYVKSTFSNELGVFVAVTDYMKALPSSIAPWMPRAYTVLGTDGYGLSETRETLRDFFEISADYIAHAALVSLYREKIISKAVFQKDVAGVRVNTDKIDPMER
ncbi:MAG: pyruvate dehydrogenase (acetyl-transferring), homodimeric type [Gammaproteobacteria bacterium]|nr:pyruvate dehydrogenase (acetyl-transferring), homodimeric type [Gammaproteobacteria bacterium]MDP2141484.1 pyruvate dehydrogenase (acetyl-transferring), homodimeric type [Gammaproteobacteria bacterium]MDP2347491.1 pyruvate dehydrogenase (acetyl-transferring), homodimeric type [Gammaproteobacteria bacterium]